MNSVGAISYGVAAAAFALLTVLCCGELARPAAGRLSHRRERAHGAWARCCRDQPRRMPVLCVFFVEMLRNAGWLLALTFVAKVAAPRPLVMARAQRCAGVLAAQSRFLCSRARDRSLIRC